MLDAFIIEKIKRENELRDDARQPLRIEISREPERGAESREERSEDTHRGAIIIDYSV
jgi:hypothetical protein